MSHLRQKACPDASANFRLPLPVLKKLDNYCASQDFSRSYLLRKLITTYEPVKQMPDDLPGSTEALSYPGWLTNKQ
jgi:hypothetical protein